MIITDTPPEPFFKISIDTVGPLPTSPRGNKYMLTIQDNLIKYCIAVAMPDATGPTIADALALNVINVYGAPWFILFDQAKALIL